MVKWKGFGWHQSFCEALSWPMLKRTEQILKTCQISHCSDIQNGWVVSKSGMSPCCQPVQSEGGVQEGRVLLYISF